MVANPPHQSRAPGSIEVRELWGPDHSALLYAAVSCGHHPPEEPVEAAILRAAEEGFRIDQREIERRKPRTAVRPFEAGRPLMSVRREDGVLYVKGDPGVVLPLCRGGQPGAREASERLASRGLHVLAVATGSSEREENLTLWGLIAVGTGPAGPP